MKKFLFKILILVVFLGIVTNYCNADSLNQEEFAKTIIESNKSSRPKELIEMYDGFKRMVSEKQFFGNVDVAWSFFDSNNDKLLIGSSGAVFCGSTMQSELLKKYGYDVIGFGGIFDEEIADFLTLLGDKKYKTIVIFGGVNDVNVRAAFNLSNIDLYYCKTLIELINEAKKHLKSDDSNVYYIKVKPMTLNRDSNDEKFVNRFNSMAKEINDNIESFGFKSYDFPQETIKEYSEHYVHYNNVVVYETLFESVD